MRATPASIPDVLIIESRLYCDERGFFFESFNEREFSRAAGRAWSFVQDNHSRSSRGVLRGLHYQVGRPQGKLVRVVAGEIFDVAVDLRRSSPTFGRWAATVLSAASRLQLWLPPGFAHGFLVTSDAADVLYKTTDYYSPADERTIAWNDPDLGIAWPLDAAPVLSAKDAAGLPFRDAETFS